MYVRGASTPLHKPRLRRIRKTWRLAAARSTHSGPEIALQSRTINHRPHADMYSIPTMMIEEYAYIHTHGHLPLLCFMIAI